MPKAIDMIAWMSTHLLTQVFDRSAITLVAGAFVRAIQQFAGIDLIDVVFVGAIGTNGSIGLHEVIDPIGNKVKITLFACGFTCFLNRHDLQAMLIMPLKVVQRITLESGLNHADGPCTNFLRRCDFHKDDLLSVSGGDLSGSCQTS